MKAAVLLLAICACGGPTMAPADAVIAQRDRHLAAFAYAHADGGALSADVRAIFCDQDKLLLSYEQDVDDAGIRCR